MPLRKCQKDGKSGWSWGNATCFTGEGAREKARKQGIAIELGKKRAGKPSEFDKANDFTAEEIAAAEQELALVEHVEDLLK